MASVEERLAGLEQRVENLRDDIADLGRSINGPNGSLRGRIHKLEGDVSAARIAAETIAKIRSEQGQGFTKKQQIAVLIFGAIAALGTTVSVIVAVSQLGG